MYDTDDRSEWTDHQPPRPTEQPRLVEYDWVHERKQEKRVPIAIIDALLADLDDDTDGVPALN